MRLHNNTQKAIEIAHSYREGKWLFIRSESMEDVQDTRPCCK